MAKNKTSKGKAAKPTTAAASAPATAVAAPVRVTHVRSPMVGQAVAPGAAVHDLGGFDFGAIDRTEHDPALWEKRVDAMMILLYSKKGLFKVDAMRRVIEDYGQQAYDETDYYDKWVRAMRTLLVEQEVLSRTEIEAAIAAVIRDRTAAGRQIDTKPVPW